MLTTYLYQCRCGWETQLAVGRFPRHQVPFQVVDHIVKQKLHPDAFKLWLQLKEEINFYVVVLIVKS
ncbi:hypothetical protein V7182_05300 [Neobacillus drentensis]|uniref:hypothetical protein n=1 Tax=Neobacillus drentensis TaxID=220684 RepID=UPI0030005B37